MQRRNFGAARPKARTTRRSSSLTGVASVRYLPSGLFVQLEAPWNKAFQDEMKKSIPTNVRVCQTGL